MNSFISGISLPLPLSADEEKQLFAQLHDNPKIRNTLIERNLRLVIHVAKKFQNPELSLEDLFSIGCIGLIKAVNTFSYEKSPSLATYASRCIENEILMYLRKNQKHLCTYSLNFPLHSDKDGNTFLLEDILTDESEYTIANYEQEVENIQTIENVVNIALNHLSKIKAFVFFSYISGRNQNETTSILHLSQSYICRICKASKTELEKVYETQNILQDKYSFSILNDYHYQLCLHSICDLRFKETFEDFLSKYPHYLPIFVRFEENSQKQFVITLNRTLDTFKFIADFVYNT